MDMAFGEFMDLLYRFGGPLCLANGWFDVFPASNPL